MMTSRSSCSRNTVHLKLITYYSSMLTDSCLWAHSLKPNLWETKISRMKYRDLETIMPANRRSLFSSKASSKMGLRALIKCTPISIKIKSITIFIQTRISKIWWQPRWGSSIAEVLSREVRKLNLSTHSRRKRSRLLLKRGNHRLLIMAYNSSL